MTYKLTRDDLDELFGPSEDIDDGTLVRFLASRQLTERQAAAYRCLLAEGGTVQVKFADMLAAGMALSALANSADEVYASLARGMHSLRQLQEAVRNSPALRRVATLDWITLERLASKLQAGDTAPEGATEAAGVVATADAPDDRPAPTLDDLRATLGPHVDLRADLLLKEDGRVYYEDGQPFDGCLTIRELRLLETSGRLLAPSAVPPRTSKDFRKLPSTL